MRPLSLFLITLVCAPTFAGAITLGQVDDFQDATLQGWRSGSDNPNGPVNTAGAGPDGAGDRALIATANGTAGAGGKLVIFNTDQWAGDYLAAGVNAIGLDLSNLSATDLTIRAVLTGTGGSFSTTQTAFLPGGDPTYRHVALSLQPEDLISVGAGEGDVLATLGTVRQIRLLHSASPDFRGDPVVAQLAVDNVTALGDTLMCAPGIGDKADVPADLLVLPGFEVDTGDPAGRTTFLTVHNQTDEPRVARVQYFDAASSLQTSTDIELAPRDTQPINLRTVPGLAADPDGFRRGWVQVLACAEGGGELAGSFTGDYLFLDSTGDFATGDQLLRSEDFCSALQVRLLNFGSGVTLRLFATDPQGVAVATASFAVHGEDGSFVESGSLFLEENLAFFDAVEVTETQFGILDLEFLTGVGALTVEYSAFGRFSVSMNATCVAP
jgi:hypothetical protein